MNKQIDELKNNKHLDVLKWIFIIVTSIYIFYATVTLRGLYEDGAANMLYNLNSFSRGTLDFFIDNGHPRFIIMALLQIPVKIAYFVFNIQNKVTLMMIFSCTHFLLPVLVLWWNYILAKRTDRFDIFCWSLFSYSAITILYSIFSVVETILGSVFHFILWTYLASNINYKKRDIFFILFLLFAMFGTYEYVSVLGIIFFLASFYYAAKEEDRKNKLVKRIIGIGALLASVFNIIFMFNVPGEKGEIFRFSGEAIDFYIGVFDLNLLITAITLIVLIIVFFMKEKLKTKEIVIISIFYFFALMKLINCQNIDPVWEQHMRTIPCWAMPIIFFIMWIIDIIKKDNNIVRLQNMLCVILICGITQTCWQWVNTYYWDRNIQYMKSELAHCDDLLYIPSEHEQISSFDNNEQRRYIWHSVYAPTSILFSEAYEPKTLLVNYDEPIQEGNLTFRNELYVISPELIHIPFGIHADIKNKFWDLTKCAEALSEYDKKNNIHAND